MPKEMFLNNSMTELSLRDIHLPDPVSWWPLAFGWWLVFGVVFLLILLAYVIIRRCIQPTLRKQTSTALDIIEKKFNETENSTQCLSELSVLLRRVVLSQKLPLKSAGLTGKAWLELLDQPLGEPEFSKGIGQILLVGPYQYHVDRENVVQFIQLCRKWVDCL